MKNQREPILLVATGIMQQQAAVTGFLGRAVEEKFHLKAFSLRIMPCIPLISDNLKKMVHPEIGPFNLSAGVREGYFSVNLSLNQNFQLGTEFYPNERANELFGKYSTMKPFHGIWKNEKLISKIR